LFKECASMLRITTQKIGSKQIFQHGFEIKGPTKPDRVYLGKMKADGMDEGPIHVQTAQGPRTAIKRVDYCEKVKIGFEVWVLHTEGAEKRHVGEEEVIHLLAFGTENGLGADRSQGHGKFDVLEFQNVSTGKNPRLVEDIVVEKKSKAK
jgi:CRISPR/Cas system CSM-associated protein Csm4 (group 5 of RAMP superfamily)